MYYVEKTDIILSITKYCITTSVLEKVKVCLIKMYHYAKY